MTTFQVVLLTNSNFKLRFNLIKLIVDIFTNSDINWRYKTMLRSDRISFENRSA